MTHNLDVWSLVIVYGPCRQPAKDVFLNWPHNLEIDDDDLWLIIGDSICTDQQNRNRPEGNLNDILVFNDVIGHLGLIELPLKGRSYTWTNMQEAPLLEQIDWFSPLWLGLLTTLPQWYYL